ncbi:hypothetical protein [Vibrio fluvialis]|uniref:hypothetical protein n=1 Tax=Vibrio fluvialis TaxID=676 RepID=UPI001EEBEDC5|nr:hypothetical protein [Vibrio fluvialis]MCG6391838.1 hypothetical protein [Vibrio fluvialis]
MNKVNENRNITKLVLSAILVALALILLLEDFYWSAGIALFIAQLVYSKFPNKENVAIEGDDAMARNDMIFDSVCDPLDMSNPYNSMSDTWRD